MTQQTQNPKTSSAAMDRRKTEPLWLWVALIGGSAVIHAVLAIVTIPWMGRVFETPVTFSPVPVDLIDLPPETAESGAQPERITALQSIAASPPPSPANSKMPIPRPQSVPMPSAVPFPQPSAVARSSSPGSTFSNPSETPEPPASTSEATTPNTATPAQRSTDVPETGATSNQPSRDTPTNSSPQAATTPTTPQSPGFATIPIDIPTPDVSETLPIPAASPPATPLAQVEVNRENTPVTLTVSLDFEQISVEKAGDDPDRLAAPREGVDRREVSSVEESACAGALKPEIMQSLGVKVGLQVSTDATGQVIRTAAQVPSRNPVYNELARCLVQHWGFVPAQDEGEPVPSNALLVWVTIDRL